MANNQSATMRICCVMIDHLLMTLHSHRTQKAIPVMEHSHTPSYLLTVTYNTSNMIGLKYNFLGRFPLNEYIIYKSFLHYWRNRATYRYTSAQIMNIIRESLILLSKRTKSQIDGSPGFKSKFRIQTYVETHLGTRHEVQDFMYFMYETCHVIYVLKWMLHIQENENIKL